MHAQGMMERPQTGWGTLRLFKCSAHSAGRSRMLCESVFWRASERKSERASERASIVACWWLLLVACCVLLVACCLLLVAFLCVWHRRISHDRGDAEQGATTSTEARAALLLHA